MSAYLGPKLDAAPAAWHPVPENRQLGVAASGVWVAPAPGWVTRIGVRARRVGGDPRLLLALYAAQPGGAPRDLLGRTGATGVSSLAAGGNAEGAVAATDRAISPADTAIRVDAGQELVWAVRVSGGGVDLGIADGAATHHTRTVPSGFPTDPFGALASGPGPLVAAYVVFDEDRPPAEPSALSPAAGASFNTTVPTFAGTFVDPDAAAPIGDRMREYAIEVSAAPTAAVPDPPLLWGGTGATFTASAAERAARRFLRPYNGAPLAPGGAYRWRAAVADDTRTYGPWSGWFGFTVNGAGTVDLATDGAPAGKVETDPAALTWSGRWSHPNGYAMSHAQVRVRQRGEVARLGAVVAKAVASAPAGTPFSLTAGQSGIGRLDPGTYDWQGQGRDATSGLWSGWSAPRAFRVNAPASTPTGLQPPSGSGSSAPPLLEWFGGDPDEDDIPGSDVVWNVRVKGASGTVLGTHTAPGYDPVRGVASFQLTTVHLPAGFGTYIVDVRGHDVSAGALGYSAWSAETVLVYQAGPTVTVVRPTPGQVVAGARPLLTATCPNQTRVRFRVFREDEADAFYDSGQIGGALGALGEHRVRPGYLRSGGRYDAAATAWNDLDQSATSLRVPFSVLYPDVRPPENPVASPVRYAGDPWETAVLTTCGPSDYPPGRFDHWIVTRRPASADPSAAVVLRRIRNIGQPRWTDPHPPLGVRLVYGWAQALKEGDDDVSESAVVEAECPELEPHGGVVLVSVDDPGGKRAVLWMSAQSSPADIGGSAGEGTEPIVAWGAGGLPVAARPAGRAPRTRSFANLTLHDDAQGSARGKFLRLEGLLGEVVSARSGEERLFGEVTGVEHTEKRWGYEVSVTVDERFYAESEK